MASKDTMDLELWLSELLNSVGVDGEVYEGYISGTLATMEGSSQSEMEETLVDILTGCVVRECHDIVLSLTVQVIILCLTCQEFLNWLSDKWRHVRLPFFRYVHVPFLAQFRWPILFQ